MAVFLFVGFTPDDLPLVYFGENITLTCSVTSASSVVQRGDLYINGSSVDSGPDRRLPHSLSGSLEMPGITVRDVINQTYRKEAKWVHYVCFFANETTTCQLADLYVRVDRKYPLCYQIVNYLHYEIIYILIWTHPHASPLPLTPAQKRLNN